MEMVMRSDSSDQGADSIMHRRGAGGGRPGITHEPTEEKQGARPCRFGLCADPVLTAAPGDRVMRTGQS